MSRRSRRSPLRVLAPLALVAFVIAFLVVLSNSGVSHDSGGGAAPPSTTPTGSSTTRTTPRVAPRRTYTGRAGDPPGANAIKNRVSGPNPEDPQPRPGPPGPAPRPKLK